eukprot:scaffold46911_cov20-Prasinocladus_malaysianus.AAC.1
MKEPFVSTSFTYSSSQANRDAYRRFNASAKRFAQTPRWTELTPPVTLYFGVSTSRRRVWFAGV